MVDDSVDFVFSTSLFTHLLENDLINYCREGYRVLKQGGSMAMYCFCINYLLQPMAADTLSATR